MFAPLLLAKLKISLADSGHESMFPGDFVGFWDRCVAWYGYGDVCLGSEVDPFFSDIWGIS